MLPPINSAISISFPDVQYTSYTNISGGESGTYIFTFDMWNYLAISLRISTIMPVSIVIRDRGLIIFSGFSYILRKDKIHEDNNSSLYKLDRIKLELYIGEDIWGKNKNKLIPWKTTGF